MRLLLTRPLIESKISAEILRNMGFDTVIKPLTQLTLIPTEISASDALIFTSFRALEAVTNLKSLNDLPAFVVGEKAVKHLTLLGFKTIIKGETGEDLSGKINKSQYQNFVWASGEAIAVDLIELCANKNIIRKEVYKMEYLQADIDCELDRIDGVLHYSRETTEYFVKNAYNIEYSKHFCLSKRVSDALPENVKYYISENPSEKSIFSLVSNIFKLSMT